MSQTYGKLKKYWNLGLMFLVPYFNKHYKKKVVLH